MEKPLVSCVVPIYQSEQTLRRCLDSILSQKEDRFELLLVDDGSTDQSPELCEQYARKDSRVKAFHLANGGVSAARNFGIEKARGTYVQFVDSDDWLEHDYTSEMTQTAMDHEADLVIAGYRTAEGEKQASHIPPRIGPMGVQELARDFERFYFSMMFNSPWNKLYRREQLTARFPIGVPMGEDFIFNMEYLRQIKTIAVTAADGYIYEQWDSASKRFRGNAPEMMLDYCNSAAAFLSQQLPEREWRGVYDRIVFHSLCNNLNTLVKTGRDSSENVGAFLKNPQIKTSVKGARLAGFPRAKQAVGICLKLGLSGIAMTGIRRAAKR